MISHTLPFPIDFIKIVRQKHDRADDALSRRCLKPNLGASPEEVELAADSGAVALLLNGKCSAQIIAIRDRANGCLPGSCSWGLVEVEAHVHAQSGVRWTGFVHGKAVGRDLSGDMWEQGRNGQHKARE